MAVIEVCTKGMPECCSLVLAGAVSGHVYAVAGTSAGVIDSMGLFEYWSTTCQAAGSNSSSTVIGVVPAKLRTPRSLSNCCQD